MRVSVLILTLNEEANLPRCLDTVRWSDDVVVFDSFSTDRTVEIAKDFGARVMQRRFDDERSHRTASLEVEFKHQWVFNPDADEFATPELVSEMSEAVEDVRNVAYRMRRKDMFMGRWIKHSSLYPTWLMRLFRPDKIRFQRKINLNYAADGEVGTLENHILHYSFNKGLDAWVEKHNRYSAVEAEESLEFLQSRRVELRSLLDRDPVERRKTLKELSYVLPFRPLLRFWYMYLLKGGFLDGRAGFKYCRLIGFYEYLICLKMEALRRQRAGLPV